jgi:hypothetical protein
MISDAPTRQVGQRPKDVHSTFGRGEITMFRKSIVAAAVAISAAAFVPATASAGGGYHHGGNHHGLHHRGNTLFHGGFHGWRGIHGLRGPIFASCWRWVPTRFGYSKVWLCG